MTLEGLEVLLLQPDFASPPKIVGNQKVTEAGLGEAAKLQAYVGDHPLHAFTHRFNLATRADAAILEDFVFDRAGRWQPFWLPSWHGELNPVASIASGGTSLSISTVNYASVYDPTTTNRARLGHYIFLLSFSGTMLIRRVTAVSGTSPEVLTLDSPVTEDFTLGRFAVGFVYCVALITDKVSFRYNGRDNCEVELSVTEESSIDDPTPGVSEPTLYERLVADFSTDVASGNPPLDVAFTDTSEGTPTSWLWNFGDGSATSALQNPTHTFTNAGTYQVRLRVKDANGATSAITREIIVNAAAIPPEQELEADFSFTPTTGDAALEVTFTDDSLGTPTVWLWNFGDGTTSAVQNPVHTYALPGVYTITLDVIDNNGAMSRKADALTVTQAASVPATCDSGASWGLATGYGPYSCASCCTALDAMAVDEIAVWSEGSFSGCLGITAADGYVFEFNSKTFVVSYDEVNNTGGSMNSAGAVFYDVVRIS